MAHSKPITDFCDFVAMYKTSFTTYDEIELLTLYKDSVSVEVLKATSIKDFFRDLEDYLFDSVIFGDIPIDTYYEILDHFNKGTVRRGYLQMRRRQEVELSESGSEGDLW